MSRTVDFDAERSAVQISMCLNVHIINTGEFIFSFSSRLCQRMAWITRLINQEREMLLLDQSS